MVSKADKMTPDSPLYKPIMDALKRRNFDTHELAELTGVKISVLQGRLSRMKGRRLIVSIGRKTFTRGDYPAGSINIWSLPAEKPTATPTEPPRCYRPPFVELKRDFRAFQRLCELARR